MKMKLKKTHFIVILVFIVILSILLALYFSQKGLNISDIKKLARKTAKADLRADKASILTYGKFTSYRLFDSKTGLKLKPVAGCIVSPETRKYVKAYNAYIYESVDKFGFPKNSKHTFSNIILKPDTYMNDSSTGKLIGLRKDIPVFSFDKKYSLLLSSFHKSAPSRYKLTIKYQDNEIPVLPHRLINKDSLLKIKWGPPASNIFFIQLKIKVKKREKTVDSISYYVIDLSDGTSLNYLRVR